CKNPEKACLYAIHVDKSPRDDTRQAACKNPAEAYYYAYYVDKSPRDDTRQAACKDSWYKESYKNWENSLEKT
ncbi:hypothetical protein N8Z24_00790, partial [bacterium]|nr:hypothetical protein [bacterium]